MSFVHPIHLNLSHQKKEASFQKAKEILENKIKNRGDLPHASVEKQLDLLDQLAEFEFGRFLIERGGINGYWTHYVVTHPQREGSSPFSLEEFLLNCSPTCIATQQRYVIFKERAQQHLFETCRFASIPSGIMGDLLDLDYSHLNAFTLYGIDLDEESLAHAKNYAASKGLGSHCQFVSKDAWNLNMDSPLDLIVSNGLTIYEADDAKVTDLYREFAGALKPGGILITSFLTPPPQMGPSEWKLDQINLEHALLQKTVFADILEAKWQTFRTKEVVEQQLQDAGFTDIEFFYDDAHIFPTVQARKN